jgi:hypothetical protein
MYGYPTQTVQETVDSLEMVRQLFEAGAVWLLASICHDGAQSCWNTSREIWLKKTEAIGTFANNDIDYIDSTGIDHNKFSFGLKKSLFNFMHGICFDYELQEWFEFKIRRLKFPETISSTWK